MTDSSALDPTETPALPAARPEATTPQVAQPGVALGQAPLPSPVDAPAEGPAETRAVGPLPPVGPLILQTALFGPLSVPDGAGRAVELEGLSRRAAIYATRARGDG